MRLAVMLNNWVNHFYNPEHDGVQSHKNVLFLKNIKLSNDQAGYLQRPEVPSKQNKAFIQCYFNVRMELTEQLNMRVSECY